MGTRHKSPGSSGRCTPSSSTCLHIDRNHLRTRVPTCSCRDRCTACRNLAHRGQGTARSSLARTSSGRRCTLDLACDHGCSALCTMHRSTPVCSLHTVCRSRSLVLARDSTRTSHRFCDRCRARCKGSGAHRDKLGSNHHRRSRSDTCKASSPYRRSRGGCTRCSHHQGTPLSSQTVPSQTRSCTFQWSESTCRDQCRGCQCPQRRASSSRSPTHPGYKCTYQCHVCPRCSTRGRCSFRFQGKGSGTPRPSTRLGTQSHIRNHSARMHRHNSPHHILYTIRRSKCRVHYMARSASADLSDTAPCNLGIGTWGHIACS
eukprot:PhM_4_TR16791/c0_g2_i1/m.50573